MTGLEKLVKHIEDDADSAAQAVIAQAKGKADEIAAAAKEEGEKKSAEILKQSERDVQACLSRAESTASIWEKRSLLDDKQKMIEDVLETAKNRLKQLPDSEYFDIIVKMIKKYALPQPGQILFSAADKTKLPPHFEDRIQSALSAESTKLTISEQTRELDGGFVLVYGDIEVDCSFDALFSAARESLQDKVSALLFR